MNKYYRPTINEIVPDLEFEYIDPSTLESIARNRKQIDYEDDSIWDEACFANLQEYIEIFDEEFTEEVIPLRVKYLDRQDIIDLGWEYSTDLFYKNILFKKQQFSLVYNYSTCNVMISKKECNCNSHPNVHYFNGKIKNKSELKKIMQMIGII
jgi:hypothetical protein